MRLGWRRRATAVVFVVGVVLPFSLELSPAGAFPVGDQVYPFKYQVDVTTHVQKLNQDMVVTGGVFAGGIDMFDGRLEGTLTLPVVKFTFSEASVGLLDVTAKIVPVGPVTGMVDFNHLPSLPLTATSVFNIRLID